MNDKFNDDDFSWLTNPDDPDKKDDSSEDDEAFSWQQSSESRPAEKSGKSLGFTGQLSWMKDEQDESSEEGAADEGLAWQTDEGDSSPAAPNRTGLTGTLSWQRASQTEKSSDDWMNDFSSALDKMSAADDDEPQVSQSPAAKKAEPSSDMPDWLRGADVDNFGTPAAVQVEDTFEPPDDDVPDWLRGSEPDDLYSTPQTSVPAPSADVPDWLSGMDEDEPQTPAPAASAGSFDDLFADASFDEQEDDLFGAPQTPAPAASAGSFGDLFADVDDQPDDLFSEPQASTGDVPDWLSGFDADEPPAAVPSASAAPSLDDLFGDDAEEPQWEPAPWDNQPVQEQAQEDTSVDDLFPSMDDEDEEDEPAAAPLDTGFLAGLGLSKSEPVQATSSASVDDFLASLGFDDEDGEPAMPAASAPVTPAVPVAGDDDFDWFAGVSDDEEAAPAVSESPDWLEGLGDLDTLSALTEEPDERPEYQPLDESDPFAMFDTEEEEPAEAAAPQYQDIDALMSSFGDDDMDLPKTDQLKLQGDDIDFDTLLNQDALGDIGRRKQTLAPEFTQESSDLLADLGITVGQVSASSIMRQQQDRPLEELSDRLQALRERSLDAPATAHAPRTSTSLSGVLPGVSETLPPTPIQTGAPGIAGAVILGKEQQARVALLRQMVGAGGIQAAVHGDADAPYTDWETDVAADEPAKKAKARPAVRPRRRFSIKLDRFLVSALLMAIVVLPFVFNAARIGSLPAVQFTPGTAQYAVYNGINSLESGDMVLVAVEYGPTAAGELDGMTDAILRHILSRGAQPVIVSRNPVGLLRAGNLLGATGGTANQDYYLARYLTADIVGLSSLVQNITLVLSTDVNGNPTGLNVASLDEFASIVLIVERSEDLRAWAEQIAPMTSAPLFAGTNYAAGPLAQPYLNASATAGVEGLLIGAGDAYTYRAMFEGWAGQAGIPTTPIVETPTEVEPTQQPLIVDVTDEATAEATDEETTIEETAEATPTRRVVIVTPTQPAATATDTPEPSPTREEISPTPTDVPATNTPRPTNTPEPTPTIEPVQVFAVVSVNDTVNIRAEPDRNAQRVGTARSGTRVEVIGVSEDGLWLNVRTVDGTEGWILGELLTIEPSPAPKLGSVPPRSRGTEADQEPAPEDTPEATDEATEEANATPVIRPTRPVLATPTPEAEATAETSNAAVTVEGGLSQAALDNQWYATTLGLVFIVIVIALGNLVNIIRGLLRRSRTR